MRIQMATLGAAALAIVVAGPPARAAAQQPDKAAGILAQARTAIGGGKLDALKTFSAEARTQRNVGTMQMTSEVELMLAMPDKYMRSETSSGGPMNFSSTTGFNGSRPLAHTSSAGGGGAMVIRMGPGGPVPGEKPTPEQQAEMDKVALRVARQDVSRLMLGWFATAHPALSGVTYTYAGEAESPEGKADVIDVKDADGFNARMFIDQQSHLPLMLTYQGPQRRIVTAGGPMTVTSAGGAPVQGSSRPMTDEDRRKMTENVQKQIQAAAAQPPTMVEYRMFFGEWTDVDGIKFPMKLQRATAGTTDEEWTITRVKVNPKIDLKKFDSQS
jgi:hypothetical protein